MICYHEFPQGLPTGHPLFTVMASDILHSQVIKYSTYNMGFPKWLNGNECTCNEGDTGDVGLITGLERSPGTGNSNPFQYSCPKNPMD